jgi:Flp pilus assembly protein TadB
MTAVMAAVFGVGIGAGMWLVVTGLFPARPTLRTVVAYLDGGPGPRSARIAPPAPRRELDQLVGDLSLRVVEPQRLLLDTKKTAANLAVMDRSIESHVGTKVAAAVMGLLVAGSIGGILELTGLLSGFQIPALVGLALAGGLFVLPDVSLAQEAKARRGELRSVLSMFLDCVELGLAGGYGPATALDVAASKVSGSAGVAVRAALAGAFRDGKPPWSALEELGQRWGLEELVETAGTVSLGDGGARIRQSLTARSKSLRSAVQADLRAKAKAATIRSVMPLALLGMATLVLVAYPYLARLVIP